GSEQRGRDPDDDRDPRRRRRRPTRAASGKGGSEQRQASDRQGGPGRFPARERDAGGSPDEQREHANAACRDGLHEREGREHERRDVESPAGDPRRESRQPPPAGEQQHQRSERTANRQPWHPRRRSVLCEETPVERNRRSESQSEAQRERYGHSSFFPLNGK